MNASSTAQLFRSTAAIPSTTSPARLVSAGSALWRVVDRRGLVVGHVMALPRDSDQTRFRARRYHAPSRTFRDLGDFWSPADAVECVWLSR